MKRQKTLKKQISKTMRLVSNLNAFVMVVLIGFLALTLMSPLTYYFSKSFVMNIYKHFNNAMDSSKMMFQSSFNTQYISAMSYEDILGHNAASPVPLTEEDIEKELIAFADNILPVEVDQLTEKQKKLLAYATYKAFDELSTTLPTQVLGIDLLLVTFKDDSGLVFNHPTDQRFPNDLSPKIMSEGVFEKSNSFYQHLYNSSKSSIVLMTSDKSFLGQLDVMVNPIFIMALVVPLVFIFCIALLSSFIFVSILTRVFAHSLLRPLEQVNQQIKSHTSRQSTTLAPLLFDVKNPPLEISELITNSKIILEHFTDITHEVEMQRDELEAQKEELEAQNIELEDQNQTLIETRDLLKKQQDQLVRSEKMASVGQLSAAIAHEINTPLGAIQSNAQMMDMILNNLPSEPDVLKEKAPVILPKIQQANSITLEASRRVAEIVKSIKNFSRIDQSDFQKYDIRDGFKSVIILTSNLWKNKVQIVENYGDVPIIDCYPSLLNQVFMNVVVNAIQAMEDGGTLTIDVQNQDPNLVVRIIDTGIGIQSGLLDIIFESGFTTKPIDKGTGLGLSISKEIIEKHGGKITAESQVDIGTEIIITLPIRQYQDHTH